jgi:hypothetical protein
MLKAQAEGLKSSVELSRTRRDVLLAGVAAAIVAVGGAFPESVYAEGEVTAEEFLGVSQWLTNEDNLDPAIAKTLLGGFLANGAGPALRRLVARLDELGPLANAIVGAWYSGVYNAGNGETVATFDQALVWTALDFTKPWATCGGENGYWADPPQS